MGYSFRATGSDVPNPFGITRHLVGAADRVDDEVEAHTVAQMQAPISFDLGYVTENRLVGSVCFDERKTFGRLLDNCSRHKISSFKTRELRPARDPRILAGVRDPFAFGTDYFLRRSRRINCSIAIRVICAGFNPRDSPSAASSFMCSWFKKIVVRFIYGCAPNIV